MKRYAVSVSYVGSKFSGWAYQKFLPHNKTVCGIVDKALDRMVGETSHNGAIISSRTDAGVHALYNTFHVDIDRIPRSSKNQVAVSSISPFKPRDIIGGLNAQIKQLGAGSDILIVGATSVDPELFHARFSALSREYIYRIIPCASLSGSSGKRCDFKPVVRDGVPAAPLFEIDRAWCIHKQEGLDLGAMRRASKHFLGVHDFTSFRSAECGAKSPIREVTSIDVKMVESHGPFTDHLLFKQTPVVTVRIRAPRFLQRMVRNIVGSLVTAGRGMIDPDDIPRIIAAKDRREAPLCAPAHGLYLTDVEYDEITYT